MGKCVIPHIRTHGVWRHNKKVEKNENYTLSNQKRNLLSETLWAQSILESSIG